MKRICDLLEERVCEAINKVTGQSFPAVVRPSKEPRFGDYQANGVMGAAKKQKTNPRDLAAKVVEALEISDICQRPEIAGPGFINFNIKPEFIAAGVMEMFADPLRLGVNKTPEPKTVVVDFSGPNIAKQMHVGHLRSTIIGDSIARMLEFEGHEVIRQNHIGDWGTQFGMLIAYLKSESPEVIDNPESVRIGDLEQFYKNAKAKCDQDPDFAEAARREVVGLHNGKADTIKLWQYIVDESRRHYQPIYQILNIKLEKEDERGESFYRDRLKDAVNELKELGQAVESEGALCVFPEGFKNKQGEPLPFIIQKSDGAFLYATTDLAALKYRVTELGANEIIYVTDARQKLHFEMLFSVANSAGWSKEAELRHITFGTMLGDDGKPFKTRSGENVKLRELLDEAAQKARGVVEEKNPDLCEDEKQMIADAVGIGAVKYSDYSNNRDSDYVFSFDKMLAMDGNTAPYMQYAYARIRSIERKAAEKGIDPAAEINEIERMVLDQPAELELALHLVRYGEAIDSALQDCKTNFLTQYLYDLAQKFSVFYNQCPVLGSDKPLRGQRLLLSGLTGRVIGHGLSELLGIRVVERM